MKNEKIIILLLISSGLFPANLTAQINYADFITSGEHDPYYKPAVRERQPVPLPHLREADVRYSHRVIRCIDPRQKMNRALAWPRQPLSRVLYDALWEGYLTPYRNDSLLTPFRTDLYRERLMYEVISTYAGSYEDLDSPSDTVIKIVRDHTCMIKYWVLEDWIFDARHSVFKPRILAIAPVYRPVVAGFEVPEQPLCWIPMDERLRNILASTELFNRSNQAARLSVDDFFQMRIFDSYIIYESNVFDQFIAGFEEFENDGVAALLESDRIRNDLMIFEHDLWQF